MHTAHLCKASCACRRDISSNASRHWFLTENNRCCVNSLYPSRTYAWYESILMFSSFTVNWGERLAKTSPDPIISSLNSKFKVYAALLLGRARYHKIMRLTVFDAWYLELFGVHKCLSCTFCFLQVSFIPVALGCTFTFPHELLVVQNSDTSCINQEVWKKSNDVHSWNCQDIAILNIFAGQPVRLYRKKGCLVSWNQIESLLRSWRPLSCYSE